jgi:hypothetical protein
MYAHCVFECLLHCASLGCSLFQTLACCSEELGRYSVCTDRGIPRYAELGIQPCANSIVMCALLARSPAPVHSAFACSTSYACWYAMLLAAPVAKRNGSGCVCSA